MTGCLIAAPHEAGWPTLPPTPSSTILLSELPVGATSDTISARWQADPPTPTVGPTRADITSRM